MPSRTDESPAPQRVRFEDKIKRTVALAPEVFEEVTAIATQERRSLSAQIEVLVEESLDRRRGPQTL